MVNRFSIIIFKIFTEICLHWLKQVVCLYRNNKTKK